MRNAFDAALSSNVATYKKPRYEDKRLYQAADYFCPIELAAKRYESGSVSSTYNKFFGDWKSFRANHLKVAKRKRIGLIERLFIIDSFRHWLPSHHHVDEPHYRYVPATPANLRCR